MDTLIRMAEQGRLPDVLIRYGIRRLLRGRLARERAADPEALTDALYAFLAELQQSRLAVATEKANEQHYELPPSFFRLVLGPHLKYSACLWPDHGGDLCTAEEAMLDRTCRRGELADGMEVLELGCGWGSLTLWMARYFFTGGMMPCEQLPFHFQRDLLVERHWRVNGRHYTKTLLAWLAQQDARREEVMDVMRSTYGPEQAVAWFGRWRIFFLACAELFGYHRGREWYVAHYLMTPRQEAVRDSSGVSENMGKRHAV